MLMIAHRNLETVECCRNVHHLFEWTRKKASVHASQKNVAYSDRMTIT